MGLTTPTGTLGPYQRQRLVTAFFLTADVVLLAAAAVFSFIIRLDTLRIQEAYVDAIKIFVLLVVIVRPLLLYVFGLYGQSWRYAGPRELLLTVAAMSFGTLILGFVVLAILLPQRVVSLFPRSVVLIEWMLSIFVTGGLRFSWRLLEEGRAWRQRRAATELVKQSGYDDEVDYLAALRSLDQRVAAGDLRPYGVAYDPATDSQVAYGDETWLDAIASLAALAHSFYQVGQYGTAARAYGMLLDIILLIRTKVGLVFLPPGRSLAVDVPALQRGYYLSLRRLSPPADFSARALESWVRYRPLGDGEDALVAAFAGDGRTLRGLEHAVQRAQTAAGAEPALADLLEQIHKRTGKQDR